MKNIRTSFPNSPDSAQRAFLVTFSGGYSVLYICDESITMAELGKMYPKARSIRFMDEVRMVQLSLNGVVDS